MKNWTLHVLLNMSKPPIQHKSSAYRCLTTRQLDESTGRPQKHFRTASYGLCLMDSFSGLCLVSLQAKALFSLLLVLIKLLEPALIKLMCCSLLVSTLCYLQEKQLVVSIKATVLLLLHHTSPLSSVESST